jgi:hypothetical protein
MLDFTGINVFDNRLVFQEPVEFRRILLSIDTIIQFIEVAYLYIGVLVIGCHEFGVESRHEFRPCEVALLESFSTDGTV